MATNDREAIVAKIKACLNLGAKGSGTTEAEMATALGMAKRLMAKFNLSEAEVMATATTREAVEMADSVAPTRQNPHKYEQFLAVVCEYLFSVKPLISAGWDPELRKYRKRIKFYGTATDVMIAASAYELLRNTINTMAMTCGYKEAQRDQWRVGVVVTLLRRAKEADDGLKAAEAAQCRALVVTKDALVKQYIEEKVGKLRKARATRINATDAYYKGKRDGERVDLNFKGSPANEPQPNKLLSE